MKLTLNRRRRYVLLSLLTAMFVAIANLLFISFSSSFVQALDVPATVAEHPQSNESQAIGQQGGEKSGKIKVQFSNTRSLAGDKITRYLKDNKVFESLIGGMNDYLKLPTDINVRLTNCGTVNAFYSSDDHSITMCKELIEDFVAKFSPNAKTEKNLAQAVLNATVFVFYHEMGHGLVNLLDLPITGKEEDAVDDFATLVVMDSSDTGGNAVLTAAQWFLAGIKRYSKIEGIPFWDEHSLGPQRFFTIACTVYGSDPDKYANLVSDKILPQLRAVRCPREYAQKQKSWDRLLAPYVKKSNSSDT